MNCIELIKRFGYICLIFILSLTGLGIITAGLISLCMILIYNEFLPTEYSFALPSILLSFLGVILTFNIIFHVCWRPGQHPSIKSCMTILFIFGMLAITLVSGILSFNHKEILSKELRPTMYTVLEYVNAPGIEGTQAQKSWNGLQTSFKCCGVIGYTDWYKIKREIPESCMCDNDKKSWRCSKMPDSTYVYFFGCEFDLLDYYDTFITLVGGLSFTFFSILLILIITTLCCVIKSIRSVERAGYSPL